MVFSLSSVVLSLAASGTWSAFAQLSSQFSVQLSWVQSACLGKPVPYQSLVEVVPGQSLHLNGGRRVCVTQGGVICCNNTGRLLLVVFYVGKSHPGCSARMKIGSCCTCTDSAHNAVCHVYSAFPLSNRAEVQSVLCFPAAQPTLSFPWVSAFYPGAGSS